MIITIAIASLILFVLIWGTLEYKKEKRDFNKGRCYCCGSKLRHFTNDIQGGRGYICDKCKTVTWVSYKSIDKEFLKNEQNDL